MLAPLAVVLEYKLPSQTRLNGVPLRQPARSPIDCVMYSCCTCILMVMPLIMPIPRLLACMSLLPLDWAAQSCHHNDVLLAWQTSSACLLGLI